MFEASHEGWYEAVRLGRDDGPLLSEGLRVDSGHARGGFSVQLRSCSAVPLTPSSEYAGYVSDHALRADTHCAVLCAERMAPQVERYLESVTGGTVRTRVDGTIPTGWCLYTGDSGDDGRPFRHQASRGLRLRRMCVFCVKADCGSVDVGLGSRAHQLRCE